MSALPLKADMCSALACPLWAKSGHCRSCQYKPLDEHSRARQDDPDLSELARLCIDVDRACVLLDDNVVAHGEAKAGALSGGFGREERVKHLFLHVRRNTGAVVAKPDLHAITNVFGRSGKGRRVVTTTCCHSSLGRCIEAV